MRWSGSVLAAAVAAMLVTGCAASKPDDIRMTYRVAGPDAAAVSADAARVLGDRLASAGVKGADVTATGREIVVSADGGQPGARATISALTATGDVAIYDWEHNVVGPDGRPAPTDPRVTGGAAAGDGESGAMTRREAGERAARRPPNTTGVIVRAQGTTADRWYLLVNDPALTGADIAGARPERDAPAGEPSVAMTFTPSGQRAFARMTRELAVRGRQAARAGASDVDASQHFAIVVDNRILAAPFIDPRHAPQGVDGAVGALISGGMTARDAARVAGLIGSGPLPARLVAR